MKSTQFKVGNKRFICLYDSNLHTFYDLETGEIYRNVLNDKAEIYIGNRVDSVIELSCENPDSPKNFTEILKIDMHNYLGMALLISLSINFLTFLIFVCIYLK